MKHLRREVLPNPLANWIFHKLKDFSTASSPTRTYRFKVNTLLEKSLTKFAFSSHTLNLVAFNGATNARGLSSQPTAYKSPHNAVF